MHMSQENPVRIDLANVPPGLPGNAPAQAPQSLLAALLKNPAQLAAHMAGERRLFSAALALLLQAAVMYAIFGFAMGLFDGLRTAGMDAVKVPLVAVATLLLCLPSLYIFACVGGAPLSCGQTFMLGASCMAMQGLLLTGLAPVVWLFATSTQSVPFVVTMIFCIWIIALIFMGRYIGKLQMAPLFARAGGIKFWVVILLMVTLQMATCMRPMLAKPGASWWTRGEKKFFLVHFASTFDTDRKK
jgi:hypothetical protein